MASASADGPVPATPHVASLTRSFALVPPAGVPAVIDCILASAALSSSELFFALVKAFPELTESLPKEDNANSETDMARAGILISYMAALFHLVKKPDISPDAFKIFIWSGLVPLLSATSADARDLLNQFEDLLCDAVVATQSWELMESTLVPLCLRSMGLSLGMTHPKELAVYHWGDIESRKVCSLPLTVACHLLGSLLDVSLRMRCSLGKTAGREVELVVAVGSSEAFAQNLTWDLSLTAVDMLLQGLEHRLCAVRLLFPVIFRALVELPSFELLVNGVAHSFSRSYFFSNIWERCITMFSLGHLERVDAYCLLSLYFSVFSLRGDVNRADDICDIRAENKFWVEICRGLVDKDASVRKHSLYILKKLSCDSFQTGSDDGQNLSFNSEPTVKSHVTASSQDSILSHSGMTRREKWADKEARSMHVGEICRLNVNGLDRWKAFFLLYDMLEEYGTHLVEAAWTHQISLFFQSGSCDNTMNNVTGGFYQNQMASLDGMFCWLAILWERGLVHENPQVRCLIMQSFLGVDWDTHKHYVKCVPKSFIVGSLILGLNDVVHHKDFGVGGVYTSKTIQGAANFFCQYSGELSMSERLEFICSLASLAQEESFGRPGLMAFAFCLSSAACGATTHHESKVQHYENRSPEMQVELHKGHMDYRSSDLLDALGVIIERTKQHFNPHYRLQACEKVLDAASFVVCTCCVPLGILLHFLSTLPREFIDFGGTLRKKVQQWLHCGSSECLPSSSDVELAFLRNLLDFPTTFMKHRVSTDAFISFDDEDLNAWSFEVQRWVRVLFLLITGEQHLEPTYQVILDFCSSISRCESSLDWFSPKFLILVVCLVDELQILLKKYKYHSGSCSEFEVGVSNILGQLPLTAVLMVFKRFKDTFIFIMDNLMSFANSVCSVFWSAPVGKDTNLPSSVKGKLGGPSQRRLPLLMTTSVLQAILSIKAVASIMSWTMQVEKDLWLGSSFAFLWNFSWKVILLPMNDSEAGAEVHLAAYEALVFVLKALSTAFSLFALEFVRAFNRSTFLNGQEEPPLDPFLLNFLQNINNLLTEGILTRSRRSVLMNWKWLCLDSLLSIPNNAVVSGAQLSTADTFFSDSSLRITFHDIVESLENAGETSVLPLLRSLRSIIGLFCPGKICLAVSVDNRISMEMMEQLVHSSWILHLSCNKRRIAPIAALLSSVLHCSIFSDLRMHEMSCGTQGPLKWFLRKILDEGSKSPRTIRLVALHLSGLWLTYPITVKYYMEEIKLLSLYGSVAFDEDFEAELSENLEATLEVRMLSKCPDAELAEVFLNTEMYARVIVAVLFDKLANLADANREQKDNVDAQSALLAGKMFLLSLLESAVTDKDLAKELYKKYSGVHRRKVRAWQMICVLSRFVDQDIVKQVSSIMHVCLYRNNLPAVRQYLEIFAIQIYLRFPSLVEEQLVPIFRDYNVRPQALSSYVFIAANVILYASEVPLQLKHLNVLLPPIIPLLTSHHHSLRGFTQLLVYHILCKLMPLLEPNNLEVVPLEKKCFKELKSYLAGNVDCVRLRASMEWFLTSFDPRTAASPAGIFNARNEGSDFECVPMTLMEQVITFLNDVREDLRYSMARDVIAIKNESLAMDSDHKKMEKSLECNGDSLNMYADTLLDFQKKVTLGELQNWPSYPGVTGFSCQDDFSRSLSEMEDQLFSSSLQSRNAAMGRLRGSRQQFILVASLLDRVPNLAGLARTCEVFGAAGLAVADANIVHDKQFQLISVTADKWVPIIEVPVRSMKAFLEKKKCEGFCILGLEQTANSTPLHQFSFPKKTVLVLGREKEGIPVDIIHCLDACLEIPQLGVIRSLNVHVSGAIALWEYTRQQRLKDL